MRQDLVDRIGEDLLRSLTDRENAGLVNEQRVAQAIDDAGAEIDSYASTRFTVPFNPAPAIVKTRAIDIALYRLFLAHGYDPDSADASWASAYKDAVAWLKSVAKGDATIGVSTPAPQGDQMSVMVAPARMFDRSTMEGF
jgi:phage gp36-like protein